MPRIFSLLLFLLILQKGQAQDKWDLKRCVDYALANNISVKQADLLVRFARLDEELNRKAQWPSLNVNVNTGYQFGLTENPTTGTLENRKIFSTTAGLQSGVTLFNWFSLKNTIAGNKLAIEAEKASVSKVQNDVALLVALAYLDILLAHENAGIAAVQIQQDISQLELTRKKVNAGILPELNAAELEAQLAVDSSNLITQQALYHQRILTMKALLNLDAALPFDVSTPPVELIPVESLAELQPDRVYELAVLNLPQQRVNDLRIQAAQKYVKAARGQLYPRISAFGNINSSFVSFRVPVYNQVVSGYSPTGLRVDAGGGTFYDVQQPVLVQGNRTGYFRSDPFFTQFSENFGQGVGIGIQIPILNGYRARIGVERSRLEVQRLQLQTDQDKLTLKQDIYKAYTDATSAIQKYNASRKAVEAAEKAYDYAQKRYNANLLSTYDLLNNSNRLARVRIEMLQARFEYVFRMKLLEFYKGQGLKL